MIRSKICGITNIDDALKAVYYGAWAIGFIFYKKSPRYISPSKAQRIIESLPPFVTPVGVFVNQNERAVRDVCQFTNIRTIQLHGDEEPVYCKRLKGFKLIKAFRVNRGFDLAKIDQFKVDAYLFDSYQEDALGGTGETFDWDVIKEKKFQKPVILSGGLNIENVQEAIKSVKPFAVDVSSGVEKSPGIKNPRLIKTFLDLVAFENNKVTQ